jgi:Mus7/MMS22 family
MEVQAKSKIRAFESIILKGLQSLADIVPQAADSAGFLIEGLTFCCVLVNLDVTGIVLRLAHQLPPAIVKSLFSVVKLFFDSLPKVSATPAIESVSLDQDSQEYGDASFMEEFIAAQEPNPFPSGVVISDICGHLFQIIANIFARASQKHDNLAMAIDTWISGLAILCQNGQHRWTRFLQYGGEWERIRSTNSKNSRAWCPYVLTQLLTADPSAYVQGPDHFISAWFEGIVEPNLTRQHSYTTLLLNIDNRNLILEGAMFGRNSNGKYDISSESLVDARPTLIMRSYYYCFD